jgi:hypothetical protein
MSDDGFTEAEAEVGKRRWRFPFGWVGLLAIACVIYELTQSLALGSVLVCLKFGWEDFRAARWLAGTDPLPARRSSTFWLYLAWGLWKTALVAFCMSVAFALVTPLNAAAGLAEAMRAFVGTFLVALLAGASSVLFTGVAVVLAWRGGVRLWLDSAVYRARQRGDWPPTSLCRWRANRLGQLLTSAQILLAGAVFVALLGWVRPDGFVGLTLWFVLPVVCPVVMLLGRHIIEAHVRADRPEECWPE